MSRDTYGPCAVCGLSANWRTRDRLCACGERHLVCPDCAEEWGLHGLPADGPWAVCPDAVRTARVLAGLRTDIGYREWNPQPSDGWDGQPGDIEWLRYTLLRDLRSA